MKNIILLTFLISFIAAAGCHPGEQTKVTTTSNTLAEKVSSIGSAGLWTGYYFDTVLYNLNGPGHYHAIADTLMTIGKVNDTSVSVGGLDFLLVYTGTDSASGRARYYGQSTHEGKSASLYFYYANDSLYYNYEHVIPTEAPYRETLRLSTRL